MSIIDKFITGAGLLILVYLVINPDNRNGASSIITSLSQFTNTTIGTLQGRK